MLARSSSTSITTSIQTIIKCSPRLLQCSSIQLKRLYTTGFDSTFQVSRKLKINSLDDATNPSTTHALNSSVPPIAEKPLLISFDAYDTIYTPIRSISQQYNAISTKYNINLNLDEVKSKFLKAFKITNGLFPNYGKEKGLSVYQFWKLLLNEMYSDWSPIPSPILSDKESEVVPSNNNITVLSHHEFNKMTDEIISHFETKQAYKIYDDLIPFLQQVEQNNVKLCIASNADSQVTNLIFNEFNHLRNYFNKSDIYLSYDLNVCKPDPRFFELVLTKEYIKYFNYNKTREPNQKHSDYETNLDEVKKLAYRTWHIGDEYEKDTKSVLNLGMGSILLDRHGTSGFLAKGEEVRKVHAKFYVVSSLDKVGALFGFPPLSL